MSDPELWTLETVSGPGALAEVRQTLAQMWRSHPEVPDSVQAEIGIAAGEIAANIVEHATKERPVHIRMEVAVLKDEIEVRFVDDGRALDVDLGTVRLPAALEERGRGLAIARAVLRNLSYQRTDDGNHWTLLSERFSG